MEGILTNCQSLKEISFKAGDKLVFWNESLNWKENNSLGWFQWLNLVGCSGLNPGDIIWRKHKQKPRKKLIHYYEAFEVMDKKEVNGNVVIITVKSGTNKEPQVIEILRKNVNKNIGIIRNMEFMQFLISSHPEITFMGDNLDDFSKHKQMQAVTFQT